MLRLLSMTAASLFLLLAAGCQTQAARQSAPAPSAEIKIPYTKHILPNGLTVVLHEDHKAPIVSVNVWYHVGSKDEKPGKTGFAHLFEHLMFQGSENYRDEYFKPFDQVGATGMNGTTWLDRTNYFQTVPTTALDLALWMESDRMGHFLGVVDQALLDEQRGVVQNEKRQGENAPYGKVWEHLQRASFPEGHPYRWQTIGSMEDLNAAELEDVKEWFRQYYGAANATLVIAGDIDPEEALAKAERYFGDIESGPPINRRKQWIAARTETTQELLQDQVAQTRLYRSWNLPPRGDAAVTHLSLAAKLLAGGKTSRLYQRLVQEDRTADSVSAFLLPFELASVFVLQTDVKQGVDPAKVNAAIDEELARFLKEGPSDSELARIAANFESDFVRGMERIGGFGGKSDILARGQVYFDDPGHYEKDLAQLRSATPKDVRQDAQRWLAQGDHHIRVDPMPSYETVASEVDRSKGPPITDEFPDLSFPNLQRGELANGMTVVLAERHQTPIVDVEIQFNAGYAADQGGKLGTASFTMAMLDEGTAKRSALEIATEREELGAQMGAGCGLDACTSSVSALRSQLKPSLALWVDTLRNPSFDESEFSRLKGQWLASIAQEKTQPVSMALRTLPPLLYGDGHAYSMPLTGSGTEDSITALTTDDLRRFRQQWLRPDNGVILVAGDTTMDEITALLNEAFAGWQPPAEAVPAKDISYVPLPEQQRILLINKPGAEQSVIIGGHLIPPTTDDRQLLFETVNGVLGGSFNARLNMNLREDKHWAYGAYSFSSSALGQRPFLLYAPVQTDKTAESLKEMAREFREFVGKRPPTDEEVARVKAKTVRSLPGRYETTGAVGSTLSQIVLYGWPDNHVQTLKGRIEAQTTEDVAELAKTLLHPKQATWLIVGDVAKIEKAVRETGLAPVEVLPASAMP